jgi:alkylated DNA repair dioxygenase AlkB
LTTVSFFIAASKINLVKWPLGHHDFFEKNSPQALSILLKKCCCYSNPPLTDNYSGTIQTTMPLLFFLTANASMSAAEQMQLFSEVQQPKFPDGFTYHSDFLTLQEEKDLIKFISTLALHTFQFQGYEAKRKVASFGFDYNFEKRKLTEGKPIPEVFRPLLLKVATKLQFDLQDFAEVLVTEYPEGAVINWHRDAFPFETIVGISLHSDCTFRLRPHDKAKQNRSSLLSFPVKRRSLYVMKDESRHEWQHSIAPVKHVRYSITLRTLKTM